MGSMPMAAGIAIALALVLYATGVFSERHAGQLRWCHVLLFWGSLLSNIAGVLLLIEATCDMGQEGPSPMHVLISVITIAVSAFHAIWATAALAFRRKEPQSMLHQLSILIWLIWLIPYLAGAFMDLPGMSLGGIPSFALSTMLVLVLAVLLHPTRLRDQEQNA